MDNYKWDAKDYSNFSSGQQKWGRELISKLSLKENDTVLDIGCGDGKITAEIAEQVPAGSVKGIDNSESMIKLASEKFHLINTRIFHFRFAMQKIFNLMGSSALCSQMLYCTGLIITKKF
jgi:ubiquinone/menaquinone biosynthesis C-methylase UbiE